MMRFSFRYFLILLIVAFMCGRASYAQPPQSAVDKATEETDRLDSSVAEKIAPAPERPAQITTEEAPEIARDAEVFVKKIRLVGCESIPTESFAALISRYEGRKASFKEIDDLRKHIAGEYKNRGIVASVFCAPEDIQDGTVTLKIAEGRMGGLVLGELPFFNKQRLLRYWKIPSGEILRYRKIAKSLHFMNKNPDRRVTAALRAGSQPGTTDVTLKPVTRFPMHLTYYLDNDGSRSTGVLRNRPGIQHNNLLGLDDVLLAGYSFGENFDGYYAYHSIPVTTWGTSVLYGYSHSKAWPRGDYEPYDMTTESDVMHLSLHQDVFIGGSYIGEVYSEFEGKDKVTWINEGTYNKDRLRILRFGGTFLARDDESVSSFSPKYSQGLQAFGASEYDNPYASRGARPVFSKFNVNAAHKRNLPLGIRENLSCKAQFSTTKLTPQEELRLGGIDAVRGYSSSDYYADNGALANLEFLVPLYFIPASWRLPYSEKTLREEVLGVAFTDYGYGEQRDEIKARHMLGAGAGLRIKLYDQVTLRVEWGFPVFDRPLFEDDIGRFHFSIDFQDKLPELARRIGDTTKKKRSE